MLDFKLDELKLVFDEMLPASGEDQELGSFSFRDTRADGVGVFFSVNQVDERVIVVINARPGVCAASITISRCKTLRVVDDTIGHRVLDISWVDARSQTQKATLELDGTTIIKVDI